MVCYGCGIQHLRLGPNVRNYCRENQVILWLSALLQLQGLAINNPFECEPTNAKDCRRLVQSSDNGVASSLKLDVRIIPDLSTPGYSAVSSQLVPFV